MMLVETVTMTARAVSVPFAVSTARLRRVSIDFTGVDNCTVTPSASAASSAPNPWRQKVAVVRSAAREKSSAENCESSLPQPNGPSMNSIAPRQSPRSFGITCSHGTSALRAASLMARVARTSAARKSSSSPSRA